MKLFFVSALLIATATSVFARQDFGGVTGELAQMFRQTNGTNLMRKSIEASIHRKPDAPHGISEIGIERTRCYGRCPAYTFIVQSNGTFRYTGRSGVERIGEFTGKIAPYYFEPLARFVKEASFFEMEDDYDRSVTDNPTTYTTAVADGKRKLVRNYAHAGPNKLWAIEQLIDGLLVHAEWDQPLPTKPK